MYSTLNSNYEKRLSEKDWSLINYTSGGYYATGPHFADYITIEKILTIFKLLLNTTVLHPVNLEMSPLEKKIFNKKKLNHPTPNPLKKTKIKTQPLNPVNIIWNKTFNNKLFEIITLDS